MDFFDKMKDFMDKGIEVSKEALSKAGSTVQDLGDKGVTKIEVVQLQNKIEKQLAQLGLQVWQVLSEQKETSITAEDERVSGLLVEVTRLKQEIEKRAGK